MGVQGRECLQQPPPPFPLGPSRYPASFWASGASLIPLQPGRTPWSLNSLSRSHENMFGISQKANRLRRENKKLCLQSSKENRFRLECVCLSFRLTFGGHLSGPLLSWPPDPPPGLLCGSRKPVAGGTTATSICVFGRHLLKPEQSEFVTSREVTDSVCGPQ